MANKLFLYYTMLLLAVFYVINERFVFFRNRNSGMGSHKFWRSFFYTIVVAGGVLFGLPIGLCVVTCRGLINVLNSCNFTYKIYWGILLLLNN